MIVKTLKYKGLTWMNIEDPVEGIIDLLKDDFQFHILDFKDVLGENLRPKIDVYKNYFFLVLHFPKFSRQARKIFEQEIDIFLGADFLITIQGKRNKTLYKTFHRLAHNKKSKAEFMGQGSGILFYKLLEVLYQTSFPILDYLGRGINKLEEDVYGERGKGVVTELAIIRRNILNFKKMIDPQRFVVDNLVHLKSKFLPRDLGVYFDDIHDYIEEIWVILTNYKDIVDGLSVTNEAMISHRINEVIKTLTIISVALLPLTLLSGIYGMNIKLPLAKTPQAVWGLFGVVLFLIAAAIIILRKKRWL